MQQKYCSLCLDFIKGLNGKYSHYSILLWPDFFVEQGTRGILESFRNGIIIGKNTMDVIGIQEILLLVSTGTVLKGVIGILNI